MEGVAFTIGAIMMAVVIFVSWMLVDLDARNRCAKEHNVYDCQIVKTYVPTTQKD